MFSQLKCSIDFLIFDMPPFLHSQTKGPYDSWKLIFRFSLWCTGWWWQIVWSDGWTTESITKLGLFENIRSTYKANFCIKWVGFVIWSWTTENEENAWSRISSVNVINPPIWQSGTKTSKNYLKKGLKV